MMFVVNSQQLSKGAQMALLNCICGTFENFYVNLDIKSVTKCTKWNTNTFL